MSKPTPQSPPSVEISSDDTDEDIPAVAVPRKTMPQTPSRLQLGPSHNNNLTIIPSHLPREPKKAEKATHRAATKKKTSKEYKAANDNLTKLIAEKDKQINILGSTNVSMWRELQVLRNTPAAEVNTLKEDKRKLEGKLQEEIKAGEDLTLMVRQLNFANERLRREKLELLAWKKRVESSAGAKRGRDEDGEDENGAPPAKRR